MKIALNLIMKNESEVLLRMLNSVLPLIDYYVVVDTGSTDNSKEIVKSFFDSHDIRGEIHTDTSSIEIINGEEFFIYSKARNLALDKLKFSYRKCDFGLFIDCDEEVILKPNFNKKEFIKKLSTCDIATVQADFGTNKNSRRNLFRVSKKMKWTGKTHELLNELEPVRIINIDDFKIFIHPQSAEKQKEKYLKHARLFENEVKYKNNPRDIYYLAQSYRDAFETDKAIHWYRERVKRTDGWQEERYYSQYMVAHLNSVKGNKDQAIAEYLKCSDLDTMRAEHYLNLIIELQQMGLWNMAYLFSKHAVENHHGKNPYPARIFIIHAPTYSHRLKEVHEENKKRLGIVEKEKNIYKGIDNAIINPHFDSKGRLDGGLTVKNGQVIGHIDHAGEEGIEGQKGSTEPPQSPIAEVDICIISYAKNKELYNVTTNGIRTLLDSEDNVKFNVFVVESNKEVSYNHYPNTQTIYTDLPFGYHRYLNLAVKQGKAEYVVLCNSDLTYEKGWASEIIRLMNKNPELLSASPYCPQVKYKGSMGYSRDDDSKMFFWI